MKVRELKATYRDVGEVGAKIDGPGAAVEAFRALVPEGELREHFVVLHVDTRLALIDAEVVSVGVLNRGLVHPREVFRAAIARSDAAIIVAHNHPSGDPTPSQEDYAVTRRLVEAGKILGIEVIDALVVGAGDAWMSTLEAAR